MTRESITPLLNLSTVVRWQLSDSVMLTWCSDCIGSSWLSFWHIFLTNASFRLKTLLSSISSLESWACRNAWWAVKASGESFRAVASYLKSIRVGKHLKLHLVQSSVKWLLVENTLSKQNWKHTDGDPSGEHLLVFPDTSGKSSPAATASMEAAMPALSFWQSKQGVNHNIQEEYSNSNSGKMEELQNSLITQQQKKVVITFS